MNMNIKNILLLFFFLLSIGLLCGASNNKQKKKVTFQNKGNDRTKNTDKRIYNLFFSINYNNQEIYSSKDSTYHRQYNGYQKSIKLVLDKNEIDLIRKKIIDVDFFNLPEELKLRKDLSISPSYNQRITIYLNGKTKTVYCPAIGLIENKENYDRFIKLFDLIFSILNQKEDLKKLPNSDVFYL